jgi:hypothetical protein
MDDPIQCMPVAMHLRFCIAIGCDAKTASPFYLFIYLDSSRLNTAHAFLSLFRSVYRPRSDPAACGLFETLHSGLMRSYVESES